MPSVAIVGASRGLGLEFVQQYLADGWTVHASARQASALEALRNLGAAAYRADVTDEASLAAMAAAIAGSLDLVIANAGVGAREPVLDEIDAAAWAQVMQVNALGPLLVARTLGKKVRQGGTIAALSSVLGSIADNSGGIWSYRMSKAALNMGLSCLAIELKPRDVKVLALHPGWVQTDMGGKQAPLQPAESVAGLRRVIAEARDSGHFVDYSGKPIPW
jgi:NAD(P)-dependent dehydrogenase (short-subunit alcohol dehydrogenase family)